MADVLTLVQQQINRSAIRSNRDQWHFPATTCSKWENPTLDSDLKQAKKMLFLLSLLYQSGISAPFPLVTIFIAGAY